MITVLNSKLESSLKQNQGRPNESQLNWNRFLDFQRNSKFSKLFGFTFSVPIPIGETTCEKWDRTSFITEFASNIFTYLKDFHIFYNLFKFLICSRIQFFLFYFWKFRNFPFRFEIDISVWTATPFPFTSQHVHVYFKKSWHHGFILKLEKLQLFLQNG